MAQRAFGTVVRHSRSNLKRLAYAVRDFLTLRDPALARLWGNRYETAAGVSISEDSAMSIAAFFQGVNLIAGHIASMPLDHYKRKGEKSKQNMRGSRIDKLFNQLPNPEMSPFSFKETLQAHLLTWGNGYAEIERTNNRDPLWLWPLTPDRVTPFRDLSDKRIKYRVAGSSGQEKILESDDMLHIPGLGFDGLVGYGVVTRARQSLGLATAAERFGATFFGNSATVGGVITTTDEMDSDQEKEFRASINREHQGPDRAHKFLLLSGGTYTYNRIAIPPNDAQFLQTREFSVLEIARWLNLPPHKLKDLTRATFSNIEQMSLDYFIDTLWPWLERWEDQIRRKLIAQSEWNIQYVKFNFAALLRGDTKSRYDAYHTALDDGWMSLNEVREKEDLDPLPANEGDMHLVPLNKIPADLFKEYIDKKINPPKPVALPVAPGQPGDPQNAIEQDAKVKKLEADQQAAAGRAQAAEQAVAAAIADRDAKAAELSSLKQDRVVDLATIAEAERSLQEKIALANQLRLLAEETKQANERLASDLVIERSKVETLTGEVAAVRVEATLESTKHQEIARQVEALAAERQTLSRALDEARAVIRGRTADVARLERDLTTRQATEAKRQREIDHLKREELRLSAEVTEADRKLTEHLTAIQERDSTIAIAIEERARLDADLARFQEANAQITSEATAEAESAREAVADLTKRLESLAEIKAEAERDLVRLREESAAYAAEAERVRTEQASVEALARESVEQAKADREARILIEAERSEALSLKVQAEDGQRAAEQALADLQAKFVTLEHDVAQVTGQAEHDVEASRAMAAEAVRARDAALADLAAAQAKLSENWDRLLAANAVADQLRTDTATAIAEFESKLSAASADTETYRQKAIALDEYRIAQERGAEDWKVLRSDLEAQIDGLVARVEQKAQAVSSATEAVTMAEAKLAGLERDLATAQREAEHQRQIVETTSRDLQASEAKRREVEDAEQERIAAVLVSHRALVVNVMRRMIFLECERAESAKGSRDKMKRWIETFYDGHADRCFRELIWAVKVHVAWSGRPDDPEILTRQLVAEHIEDSKRQLAAAIDTCEGDTLGAALYEIRERWQRDRIEEIATRLLQQEIDRHVQSKRRR